MPTRQDGVKNRDKVYYSTSEIKKNAMTTFPVLSQCQDGVQFKDDTNEDTQALENTVEKLNTHNRTMFNGKKDSKG